MIKKIIAILTMLTMAMTMLLSVPVSAASVPDNIRVDYMPADDGNLITKWPYGANPNSNSGAVSMSTSGNVTTVKATADITESTKWGLNGYLITTQFMESLPTFSAGDKLLFGAKVKMADTSTAETGKINVVYQRTQSTYIWPDNYPTDEAGLLVSGTEWQDFKTIATVKNATDYDDTYRYPVVGLAKGTTEGTAISLDMSTLFFGVEKAYDIEVTADSKELFPGMTTKVQAKIVNQLGMDYSGTQGGFSWYALNSDRSAYVDGINVTDNGDGTASISLGVDVAAGTYNIVAVSNTYGDFVASTQITVKSFSDYVPEEDKGNLITKWPYDENPTSNSTSVSMSTSGNVATVKATADITQSTAWGLNGYLITTDFMESIPTFSAGDKLLLGAKVKMASTSTAESGKLNVVYQRTQSTYIWPDEYPTDADGLLVSGTGWQDFYTIASVKNATDYDDTYRYPVIGLAKGTTAGTAISLDMSTLFFGVEKAYDIEVTSEGSSEYIVGTGGTFDVNARIINQLGRDYSGSQGDFVWFAYNSDRTAVADGITITKGANGTAQVTVSPEVPAGEYHIVAVSDTYEGFVKGIKINVVKVADYVPGEMNENYVVDPATAFGSTGNSGSVQFATNSDYVSLKAKEEVPDIGTTWPLHGATLSGDGLPETTFEPGTSIVFSAKVKSLTKYSKVTASIGLYRASRNPYYSVEFPDDSYGMEIHEAGWKTVAATFALPEDESIYTYDKYAYPIIGMPEGTPEGASFAISKEAGSMYMGIEQIYDIQNTPTGNSVFATGEENTATFKAQIVNQVGLPGTLEQGSFKWYVMNETKSEFSDDVELTAGEDGTATVKISESTPTGIYQIVAKSELYPDFIRSYPLTVTDGSIKHSIYVSTSGNDENEGTIDSPLKTPQAAQSLAREYINRGKEPLEVVFRGGTYRFDSTMKFGTQDSGHDDYPVVYRAYSGEDVKFKGSKELDLTKASKVTDSAILSRIRDEFKNDILVIDLLEQGIEASQICRPAHASVINKLDFSREFNGFHINGNNMQISSWPNAGYEAPYTFDDDDDINKFVYTDERPDNWTQAEDWWVQIFQMYDFIPSRLRVASVDAETNTIYTADNNGSFSVEIANPYTPTWKAYNLLEEIDLPGEYHIDVNNMKLYFMPPCDLTGATAELDVIGNPVITVQDAENITFEGIEFSQINDDGIVMTDVDNVDVLDCTFRDIGFRGLTYVGSEKPETVQYAKADKYPYSIGGEVSTANDASYNIDVKGNIFYNIGSSAIHINGGNIDTLTPSNNVVENNFICKFSQNVFWDGIVVVGVGTKVRKNNMTDSPYYAIRSYGNDHVIEYNEIYDVIKNTNDAGAIYSGASHIARGAVVQYNLLHNLKTWKETKNDWEIGIYFDDCQQGHTARYNMIADVNSGFNSNGAGHYTLTGNTIVNTTRGMSFAYNAGAIPGEESRAEIASRIANTDIYYEKYPALLDLINGVNPKSTSTATGNIFANVGQNFRYSSKSVSNVLKAFSQESTATFTNNETVDIGIFVDPDGHDYRVKSTYASTYPYALNESFDIEQIGLSENITLNNTTAPFSLRYPANKARGIDIHNDLWLSWDYAFGASKYQLTVATDSSFAEPIYDDIVPYNSFNLSDVTELTLNTTYYWKVSAVNSSRDFGATWQSEVGSFTTIGTDIINFNFDNGVVTADIATYGGDVSAEDKAVVYIASYDENGKLLETVTSDITLSSGVTVPFTDSLENYDAAVVAEVKMYIWINGTKPLTDCAIYKK